MKVVNYKTTIGALVALLAGLAPLFGVQISPEVQSALITVGVFVVGLFAKDRDVTGGRRQQG